jgi:hypothetical protein
MGLKIIGTQKYALGGKNTVLLEVLKQVTHTVTAVF